MKASLTKTEFLHIYLNSFSGKDCEKGLPCGFTCARELPDIDPIVWGRNLHVKSGKKI